MAHEADDGGGAMNSTPRKGRLGTSQEAPNDDGHERLLDVHEAAALLGLKPATLYQWAYKRRIPVVKLFGPRGALRFRLNDVEQLIKDSLRPAVRRPARD
jgi:excisionase family DNA binding protein